MKRRYRDHRRCLSARPASQRFQLLYVKVSPNIEIKKNPAKMARFKKIFFFYGIMVSRIRETFFPRFMFHSLSTQQQR